MRPIATSRTVLLSMRAPPSRVEAVEDRYAGRRRGARAVEREGQVGGVAGEGVARQPGAAAEIGQIGVRVARAVRAGEAHTRRAGAGDLHGRAADGEIFVGGRLA